MSERVCSSLPSFSNVRSKSNLKTSFSFRTGKKEQIKNGRKKGSRCLREKGEPSEKHTYVRVRMRHMPADIRNRFCVPVISVKVKVMRHATSYSDQAC